jgi:hypothetical protein
LWLAVDATTELSRSAARVCSLPQRVLAKRTDQLSGELSH